MLSESNTCCSVAQSCPTLQPQGLQPTRLLWQQGFPGKNTGVGCHFLLQGIFPTQGSNPYLCVSCIGRWIVYHWTTGDTLKVIFAKPLRVGETLAKARNWPQPGGLGLNEPSKELLEIQSAQLAKAGWGKTLQMVGQISILFPGRPKAKLEF